MTGDIKFGDNDISVMPKSLNVGTELGSSNVDFFRRLGLNEIRQALVYPNNLRTYDKMQTDLVISASLNLIKTMIARVPFRIESYDNKQTNIDRADFISECLSDMDESWQNTISEITSYLKYGHSVHEKVFRFRKLKNGSKYNDGKIGLKGLPIRSQRTIDSWVYDENGRELLGIEQVLPVNFRYNGGKVFIPKNKLLLFRANPSDGSPIGNSILDGCYETWRWLKNFREIEAIATSKNLNGVPVFTIPAKYFDENASDSDKQALKDFENTLFNVNNGEQAGVMFPSNRDDNGNAYFDFKVITATSSNIAAVGNIISRLTNEIFQSLFADILQLGSNNVGSYSLADSKASLLSMFIESKTQEIADVLNNDLIPDLYVRNGWDSSKTCKIVFSSNKQDLAVYAKALQQLAATGLIAKTPENLNAIAEQLDLPYRFDADATQEDVVELTNTANSTSRSGDGYSSATGGLNGTSNSVSEDDNSASNLENN